MEFIRSLLQEAAHPEAPMRTQVEGLGVVDIYDVEIDKVTDFEAEVNFLVELEGREDFYGSFSVTIDFNKSIDDNSTDYEYGSQRGIHSDKSTLIELNGVSVVGFKQNEGNHAVYSLPPATLSALSTAMAKLAEEYIDHDFRYQPDNQFSIAHRLYQHFSNKRY